MPVEIENIKVNIKFIHFIFISILSIPIIQISMIFVNMLSSIKFDIYLILFNIKMNLLGGIIMPIISIFFLIYLIRSFRGSYNYYLFIVFSCFIFSYAISSILKITDEMVVFNPNMMICISYLSILLGTYAFHWYRPSSIGPNFNFIKRLIFYTFGLICISTYFSEIYLLYYGNQDQYLQYQLSNMILGGAGFSDVLVYYPFLCVFASLFMSIFLIIISIGWKMMLNKVPNVIIYYDNNYPTNWIENNFARKIKDSLIKKFKAVIVGGDNIKDFMIELIKNGKVRNSLIIFTQDVFPKSIIEEPFTTNTLREYLDAGGSIFWIGDIPLWYVGNENNHKFDISTDGSVFRVLGLNQAFGNPKTSVLFTDLGFEFGLKHSWSGNRPIFSDEYIKPLAVSSNLNYNPAFQIEPYRSPLTRLWDFIRRFKGISLTGITFSEPKPKDDVSKQIFHRTMVNAWIKNYNTEYPNSGMFRIWDYHPSMITENMLDDLCNTVEFIMWRIVE